MPHVTVKWQIRHGMRNIANKVSLILFCCLIFSCVKKEEIKRTEIVPYSGPVTVEALRQSIVFRNVKSIKALSEVTVYKRGEPAGSFSGVFGYKSPGYMRTSLFGPFGLTAMDLLVSKDLIQMYIPHRDTLYEWKSPEVSFNALLDSGFRYSMDEDEDAFLLYAYRYENSEPELATKYIFDRTYLINRSVIFYKDGMDFIKIDFTGFNGRIPERIRVLFHNGMAMDFLLREPEFDTDISDDYFVTIDHADKKVRPFQEILKRFDPNR